MYERFLGWYGYVEHLAEDWLVKKIHSSTDKGTVKGELAQCRGNG